MLKNLNVRPVRPHINCHHLTDLHNEGVNDHVVNGATKSDVKETLPFRLK